MKRIMYKPPDSDEEQEWRIGDLLMGRNDYGIIKKGKTNYRIVGFAVKQLKTKTRLQVQFERLEVPSGSWVEGDLTWKMVEGRFKQVPDKRRKVRTVDCRCFTNLSVQQREDVNLKTRRVLVITFGILIILTMLL